MDFISPFPTLKHLSNLKIGQHLFDAKIGPFRRFPRQPWGDDDNDGVNCEYFCPFKFERIVENLDIPTKLKPDLSDVLMGIYHQVWNWLQHSIHAPDFPKYHLLELHFDPYGNLDESRIWDHYFDKEVKGAVDIRSLLRLLDHACFHMLLPQIDLILRTILVRGEKAASDKEATKLVGPCHEIIGKDHTLIYRFANVNGPQSAHKVMSVLNSFNCSLATFGVFEVGLVVTLESPQMNFQSFKKHCSLLDSVGRKNYAKNVINVHSSHYFKTGLVVDVFRTLDHETQISCLNHFNAFDILEFFLLWPFIGFFIPLLKLSIHNLNPHHYFQLFVDIAYRIPKRSRYGVLYSDLLMEFWSTIPPSIKKEFYLLFCGFRSEDYNVLRAMEELSRKNSYIFYAIVEDVFIEDSD